MLYFSWRTCPRNVVRTASRILERSQNKQMFSASYHNNVRRCTLVANRSTSALCTIVYRPASIVQSKPWFLSTRGLKSSSVLRADAQDVLVPTFADSVSEGDVRWEKNVGDQVAEDETVCEIETDKTSIAVPAPGNGIIEERYVQDGTTVKAGQKLFRIKLTGGAPVPKPQAETSKPAQAAPPAATSPASTPPPPPSVKPAAPSTPPPPTPKAPKAAVPPPPPRPVAAAGATVKVPPADYTKEITGTRTEQRVKMNRMRHRIAERLKDAQNTNAMLTTFNEIDMTNIIEFRKQQQEAFQKKYGIKLGFMSAFVKAAAHALLDQPVVNAVIDPSGAEIVYRDYVDISVAVATPKGLVVPVLRNVESMNFAEIEMGINALGEKARKNALAIEDMDGGTFTISNGGVFGSLFGTPIINPPQSAILGMHATFDRPVARNGQIVIRPMMYIALTYDHRLIDGREAVLFLRKIKAGVEDPRIIVAGL